LLCVKFHPTFFLCVQGKCSVVGTTGTSRPAEIYPSRIRPLSLSVSCNRRPLLSLPFSLSLSLSLSLDSCVHDMCIFPSTSRGSSVRQAASRELRRLISGSSDCWMPRPGTRAVLSDLLIALVSDMNHCASHVGEVTMTL